MLKRMMADADLEGVGAADMVTFKVSGPAEYTAGSAIQPNVAHEQGGPQSKSLYTTMDQFNFLATLGKGVFAKVMLAESKSNQQLYAIKIFKKELMIENDEVKGIKTERNVFLEAREHNHPFIAPLISTFQTETRLYFVMEYFPGGNLMHHIGKAAFGVTRSKFYGAEVCLVLKFLHENGIIYRNLELDNIMLTSEGHIQVFDFGIPAEGINDHYGLTSTFCGTSEFLAPEILLDKRYGRAVDWWAFGVLMYQMLLQQSPFRGKDEDEIYNAILHDEPPYPIHMPNDAKDLIQKLLAREPEERFGYHKGAKEIMNHEFFKMIDWGALYRKEVMPQFRPAIRDREDLSNFDTEFTSKTPTLSPVQSVLTQAMQEEFRGF